MFRNYLIIAWRNITRNKVNSVINVSGLAIGMTCVIFILLYVQNELGYDRSFKNANRIFTVTLDGNFGGQQFQTSNTPPTIGPALQREFPEVKAYTRTYIISHAVVSNDVSAKKQNHFKEKNLMAVDSNFLEVFDYSFKEGNAAYCLQKPHSIVLTESTAKKYFGNDQAIGKNLLLDEYKEPFTVTAILKDLPSTSSMQFDMLIPVTACPPVQFFSWSWVWCQMNTYVTLNKKALSDAASLKKLESKFPAMVKVQAANAFARIGQPLDEFFKKGGKWDFHLQRLTDIHLYSANISSQLTTIGDIKYVYIFSAVALFIITLACVNFMNLSTAQSAKRAKEVGVRKALGSLKKQLIKQFLTEAILYSLISTAIALLLVGPLLPLFNNIAGRSLSFTDIFKHGIWLIILALSVITGVFAGSYPAFYLTAFNPVNVLKGQKTIKSAGNLFIRNGLVVFQFSVSIALIICTVIVFQQLKFTQSRDIGLKKENVIIIRNNEKIPEAARESFRQELSGLPGVLHTSITSDIPGIDFHGFTDFYLPEKIGVDEPLAKDITLSSFVADENFIPTLNMQILQGRNFSKDYSDSGSVIVNETTVQQIGWKEPLGKYITYPGNGNQRFRVIAVVKDFNVESFRKTVTPFALFHVSSKTYDLGVSYLVASVKPGIDMASTLKSFEKKWKSFSSNTPFEYSFLDKDYEALYRSEQRMSSLLGIFTGLSIFVACLGLFGLSAYTAERRTKEIGIRKVLGATVSSIVSLLSKDFTKPVLVAAIIAFPLAWWAMNKWLQDFAYRVAIDWRVFILAGICALCIALITVSFQAIKVAVSNPVKSLRTE